MGGRHLLCRGWRSQKIRKYILFLQEMCGMVCSYDPFWLRSYKVGLVDFPLRERQAVRRAFNLCHVFLCEDVMAGSAAAILWPEEETSLIY